MTDKELFCNMLNRAGVRYEQKDYGNFYGDVEGTVDAVELRAQDGRTLGYRGFTASFSFDKQTGDLNSIYIWE